MSIKTAIRDAILTTDIGCFLYRLYFLYIENKKGKLFETVSLERLDDANAPRLLFDLTAAVDGGTSVGLSMVARELYTALHKSPPDNHILTPIAYYGRSFRYVDTNDLIEKLANDEKCKLLSKVSADKDDIFFSPDDPLLKIYAYIDILKKWRSQGTKLYVTIHDLIPINSNAFVSKMHAISFREYISNVLNHYDGAVAISRYVANDLIDYARSHKYHRDDFKIAWVHNGVGRSTHRERQATQNKKRRRFLMVGTIDPRKGHLQVIDAFEKLCVEGVWTLSYA